MSDAQPAAPTQEDEARALSLFVGAGATPDGFVTECATEAREMVEHYVGSEISSMPAATLRRAIREVGADLYHRRAARNGVSGFEDTDLGSSPIRINRDPMAPAYPILRQYMRPGIA